MGFNHYKWWFDGDLIVIWWWFDGDVMVIWWWFDGDLPCGQRVHFANWKMAIEIVDLQYIFKMVMFHNYVSSPEGSYRNQQKMCSVSSHGLCGNPRLSLGSITRTITIRYIPHGSLLNFTFPFPAILVNTDRNRIIPSQSFTRWCPASYVCWFMSTYQTVGISEP